MIKIFNFIFLFMLFIKMPLTGQVVTQDEAKVVAQNWLDFLISKSGKWGAATQAQLSYIDELKADGMTLGYFCSISPRGYILLSSTKNLSPILAFSEHSNSELKDSNEMVTIIKNMMLAYHTNKKNIPKANKKLQLEAAKNSESWHNLLTGSSMQYSVVGPLIKSNWDQGVPYYNMTPKGDGCLVTKVGCVATAASQIMYYWCWPPKGEGSDGSVTFGDHYNWKYITNDYIWNGYNWEDENGNRLNQNHLNAVAELCYEVGVSAGTDYGCSNSTAWLGMKPGQTDMSEAYKEHFRYNENLDFEIWKPGTSAEEWFRIIKDNINANQPLQYGIMNFSANFLDVDLAAHSMVCDGWKQAGNIRMIHLNYGWAGETHSDPDFRDIENTNAWFALQNIPRLEGWPTGQAIIRKIRPAPSLKSTLSGTYYAPSFEYRYFNVNATGTHATFEPGHKLQFLHNTKVTCNGSGPQRITFKGVSTMPTWLFSRGDLSRGIRIRSGHIYLYQNGSIKLH